MKVINNGKPSIKSLPKLETEIFASSLLVEIMEWKKTCNTCIKTSTRKKLTTPTKKENKDDTK